MFLQHASSIICYYVRGFGFFLGASMSKSYKVCNKNPNFCDLRTPENMVINATKLYGKTCEPHGRVLGRVTHSFEIKGTRARGTGVCPGRVRDILGLESNKHVLGHVLDRVTHYFEPHNCVRQ